MDIQRKMRTPTWNETCSMAPCNSTVHMSTPEFQSYPKIPRYSREIIITEKIDGSNGQIYILRNDSIRSNDSFLEFKESPLSLAGLFGEDYGIAPGYYNIFAGSRNRWVTTDNDNFGFASWVKENAVELLKLGEGRHFGEWWGKGIQRGYGLDTKKFSLFNVNRWNSYNKPDCCDVIPVLYKGPWTYMLEDSSSISAIDYAMYNLREAGSFAAPGYMNPEGIIIFHTAGNYLFKKTFMHDTSGKPE